MTLDTIGKRLTHRREEELKIPRSKILERCGHKMSERTLYNYEKDVSTPSADDLVLLSRAYEVSVQWIVTGEEVTIKGQKKPAEPVEPELSHDAWLKMTKRLWEQGELTEGDIIDSVAMIRRELKERSKRSKTR